MTKEQLILQSNLAACRQRIEKLRYSIAKNSHLFPITPRHPLRRLRHAALAGVQVGLPQRAGHFASLNPATPA